jgi:arsenate reductase
MPAPLGKTPTRKMPRIDVFGLEDSRSTRAAIRFFRERRIVVTFVDLAKRPMDAGDLRWFVDRLGPGGVLAEPTAVGGAGAADGSGAAAGAAGVAVGTLLARVRADAKVLRLPLVRHEGEATSGRDEATWKAWLARGRAPKG